VRRLVLLLTLAAALSACGSITGAAVEPFPGLTIHGVSGTLVVRNDLDEAVHYAVWVHGGSGVPDPQPDPTLWPSVAARSTARLPYATLNGYEPGARRVSVTVWSASRGHARAAVLLR
jgi:hypothetical protein